MKVQLVNRVEHMVTKGEIALFKQFLLLSLCFQKTSDRDVTKALNHQEALYNVINPYYHISPTHLYQRPTEIQQGLIS